LALKQLIDKVPASRRNNRGLVIDKINLDEKFSLFREHWRPKIVATVNGQDIKIIKVKGEFVWHRHNDEHGFFMTWKGRFRVEFRNRVVELGPGECVVVPKGVEHRTCAEEEALVLCFEPAGVLNTGNFRNEQTATVLDKI
jgi:mannose-6-phosphate isomerase-like protein (cupin superfamily)